MGIGGVGDDIGQSGLAAAGRPPENHRRDFAAFDGFAQDAPFAQDMLLPDEGVQAGGAHPGSQRRLPLQSFFKPLFKHVLGHRNT